MGKLDKDIHQKEMAIRFCLVNDMTPFLEVNIQNHRELSDTSTIITDIDVMGIESLPSGKARKTIFDCKTLNKTSPINRAFWASGLMRFSNCEQAFIVLRKRASEAHRLSARQIDVHLFDEKQFNNYGESCSIDFNIDYCYSSNISSWLKLYDCSKGNVELQTFVEFISNVVPMEVDYVKAYRKFTSALKKVKGELDPQKPKHQAIFYYTLSIFSFIMSQIVHDLRNIVDFDADELSFEKILKYYIWGGRESYTLKQNLQKAYNAVNQMHPEIDSELKMNKWMEFIELCRNLLDSPNDIQKCITPMRELGFRTVVEKNVLKEEYCKKIIVENNRIRQYSQQMAAYLISVGGLPKEFMDYFDEAFNELKYGL
ncbi:hypothetical protein Q4Q54_17745 [Shewanella sp. SP2S2-4]|uniref:hypothetical protein n=1 Tax=Shewanella sp. SP2S2-4 TaxID=3063539 RepID=UPI00288CD560|nr:hypothetical protein [Shewanella sp. SP2S2-4]MDT3275308.1 hypothetical protein [Shewanella sp. SP2S2-4]